MPYLSKANIYIFCLSTIFFVSCRTSQSDIKFSDLRGIWVSQPYLQIIASTKSPLKGFDSTNVSMPFVDIQDNLLGWTPNFHEGASIVVEDFHYIDSSSIYEFTDEGMSMGTPATYHINIVSDSVINLTITAQDKHFKQTFVRVGLSFEQWLNSQTISGEYRDMEGNRYLFADSGFAQWPMRSFRYEVLTDFVLGTDHRDRIIDFDRHDTLNQGYLGFAFSWSGSELSLFEQIPYDPKVDDGINDRFATVPFIVLQKIK